MSRCQASRGTRNCDASGYSDTSTVTCSSESTVTCPSESTVTCPSDESEDSDKGVTSVSITSLIKLYGGVGDSTVKQNISVLNQSSSVKKRKKPGKITATNSTHVVIEKNTTSSVIDDVRASNVSKLSARATSNVTDNVRASKVPLLSAKHNVSVQKFIAFKENSSSVNKDAEKRQLHDDCPIILGMFSGKDNIENEAGIANHASPRIEVSPDNSLSVRKSQKSSRLNLEAEEGSQCDNLSVIEKANRAYRQMEISQIASRLSEYTLQEADIDTMRDNLSFEDHTPLINRQEPCQENESYQMLHHTVEPLTYRTMEPLMHHTVNQLTHHTGEPFSPVIMGQYDMPQRQDINNQQYMQTAPMYTPPLCYFNPYDAYRQRRNEEYWRQYNTASSRSVFSPNGRSALPLEPYTPSEPLRTVDKSPHFQKDYSVFNLRPGHNLLSTPEDQPSVGNQNRLVEIPDACLVSSEVAIDYSQYQSLEGRRPSETEQRCINSGLQNVQPITQSAPEEFQTRRVPPGIGIGYSPPGMPLTPFSSEAQSGFHSAPSLVPSICNSESNPMCTVHYDPNDTVHQSLSSCDDTNGRTNRISPNNMPCKTVHVPISPNEITSTDTIQPSEIIDSTSQEVCCPLDAPTASSIGDGVRERLIVKIDLNKRKCFPSKSLSADDASLRSSETIAEDPVPVTSVILEPEPVSSSLNPPNVDSSPIYTAIIPKDFTSPLGQSKKSRSSLCSSVIQHAPAKNVFDIRSSDKSGTGKARDSDKSRTVKVKDFKKSGTAKARDSDKSRTVKVKDSKKSLTAKARDSDKSGTGKVRDFTRTAKAKDSDKSRTVKVKDSEKSGTAKVRVSKKLGAAIARDSEKSESAKVKDSETSGNLEVINKEGIGSGKRELFIKSRGNLKKVNHKPKLRYTLKRDENGNYTFGTCKKKKKTFKGVSEKDISDPYDINTISDTESDSSSRTLEKIRALLNQKRRLRKIVSCNTDNLNGCVYPAQTPKRTKIFNEVEACQPQKARALVCSESSPSKTEVCQKARALVCSESSPSETEVVQPSDEKEADQLPKCTESLNQNNTCNYSHSSANSNTDGENTPICAKTLGKKNDYQLRMWSDSPLTGLDDSQSSSEKERDEPPKCTESPNGSNTNTFLQNDEDDEKLLPVVNMPFLMVQDDSDDEASDTENDLLFSIDEMDGKVVVKLGGEIFEVSGNEFEDKKEYTKDLTKTHGLNEISDMLDNILEQFESENQLMSTSQESVATEELQEECKSDDSYHDLPTVDKSESDAIVADDKSESDAIVADDKSESDTIVADDKSESDTIVADDKSESDAIVADDKSESDTIVADDKSESDAIVADEGKVLGVLVLDNNATEFCLSAEKRKLVETHRIDTKSCYIKLRRIDSIMQNESSLKLSYKNTRALEKVGYSVRSTTKPQSISNKGSKLSLRKSPYGLRQQNKAGYYAGRGVRNNGIFKKYFD